MTRSYRPPASEAVGQAITLQFHPDWPHQGRTVIESMARDRAYRSQFATGVSNGGLTAFPGGKRWGWESRLFEGRYDDAPPDRRPLYGAWNRTAAPYGAAIRFGSCYVRLRAEVVERATFCFPDSVFDPDDMGDVSDLRRLCDLADETDLEPLDDYVEAHVHGPVRFETDVDAVVLDPATSTQTSWRLPNASGVGSSSTLVSGPRRTPSIPRTAATTSSSWPARWASS